MYRVSTFVRFPARLKKNELYKKKDLEFTADITQVAELIYNLGLLLHNY